MAAATVTRRLEGNNPTEEVVVLEVSDGETYVSKKFGTILGAIFQANADADTHKNVTFSGGTATINWASASDAAGTLTLFGRK